MTINLIIIAQNRTQKKYKLKLSSYITNDQIIEGRLLDNLYTLIAKINFIIILGDINAN